MVVDSGTYLVSMLQVYSALILLVFVFPMLMWREYLRGKWLAEKLIFCALTQICFVVNWILLTGIVNLLGRGTLIFGLVLEYGLVRWTYSDRKFFQNLAERTKALLDVMRGRLAFADYRMGVRNRRIGMTKRIGLSLRLGMQRMDWLSFVVVAAALLYNAWYLTHQVRIYHCYQFSDLPVHMSWVYGMKQGTLFVDGIYPFAMHAMLYATEILFGLNGREVMLYFGSFQTLITVLALYMFGRTIFRWKHSSYLLLLLWCMLLNQPRYGGSLPQECGIFAMFTMGTYLVRMLRAKPAKLILAEDSPVQRFFRINQYLTRRYLTADFFLLTISVGLIIAFHFYTAIAAIILAVLLVLTHLDRFLRKQYLVPIAGAAILGALLAITPFALAFASGTPFQLSMNWAVSVIMGEDWQGTGYGYLESIGQEETGSAEAETEPEQTADTVLQSDLSAGEKLKELAKLALSFCQEIASSTWMVWVGVAAMAAAPLMLWFRKLRPYARCYLSVIAAMGILAVMGCAEDAGLPVIMDRARCAVFITPLFYLTVACAMDEIFSVLSLPENRAYQAVLALVSLAVCAAIGFWLVAGGYYHGYFAVNMFYYNEADFLSMQIRRDSNPFEFTIVSPTDEYYAIVDRGYHYELSQMVSEIDRGIQIRIPTPYVFFFIEKYTLQDYFNGRDYVNADYAQQDFLFQASEQDYYYQRNIIESKAYYWAQAYMKQYPNNLFLYYEDDIYQCYVLRQDANTPLILNADYSAELADADPFEN